MGHFADLLIRGSIGAKSELHFMHHPHEAHKCVEARAARDKWGTRGNSPPSPTSRAPEADLQLPAHHEFSREQAPL
jgi:hypothetical protein